MFRGGPQLPAGLTQKKKYEPKKQPKRINWDPIHVTKIKGNSFWTKVKEEKLEKDGFLDLLSETFASKPGRKMETLTDGSGVGGAAEEKKKGTELKVLDGKTAQNLCNYNSFSFLYLKEFTVNHKYFITEKQEN